MELLANVTAANFFSYFKYVYFQISLSFSAQIHETTTHFMQEGNVAFASFEELLTE